MTSMLRFCIFSFLTTSGRVGGPGLLAADHVINNTYVYFLDFDVFLVINIQYYSGLKKHIHIFSTSELTGGFS